MKLAIFGSTGNVGQHVVAQALAQGHDVTAHTRNPEKFKITHPRLKIIKGDVLDPASVDSATQGQDAVVCTLGMPLMNKEGLRTKGTKNIINAMEKAGVKRFVCLSGLGAGDSLYVLPLHYRYFVIPVVLRRAYADHTTQEALIRNSQLDWTIARPANFTKGKHTSAYKHGLSTIDRSLKLKISYDDVADFMVKQLSDNTYLHQSPGLSY